MNIIIFGPPGAGKGTQSDFIVNKFNFFKLSTGDLLREEIKNKSPLGLKITSIVNSGSLVSDIIINSLIENIYKKGEQTLLLTIINNNNRRRYLGVKTN